MKRKRPPKKKLTNIPELVLMCAILTVLALAVVFAAAAAFTSRSSAPTTAASIATPSQPHKSAASRETDRLNHEMNERHKSAE